MEEYRRKLKIRNIWLAGAAAALAAVQALSWARVIKPLAGGDYADLWNGFIAGAALGVTALLVIGIVKNLVAMGDEKKLKKLIARENDERGRFVTEKGKSAGASVYLAVSLPAAVICGYFSITVFVTCVVCTFVLSVIIAMFKIYYSRKY